MKKRIIAFLLCFALVMPILPAFAVTTEDITLSATSVTLPQYEKKTITAAPGADVQVSAYQWQIKVPGTDLWVDISGAKGATLELSYAMVASLLQDDQAQIRCEAVIGGETVETEVVTVTMDYTSEPAVVTESEPVEPKVLTQATVVESSVSAPASNAKQEETVKEDSDLAALEEARNAAITAEGEAEAAVAAAQEKLTAAQNAEAAAKAALDQAQADYDAAVAAAVPAETEAEDAETTEAAPAVTVDSTARDAAETAYADAQNATAAAQKELDEANAALTAAQAKTADAQKAYEAAEAETATTAMAAFSTTRRTSSAVMMADASEEELQKFTVVINYLFEDNSMAAEPYTATLAKGSSLKATINNPYVMGYQAYYENAESESIAINVTNISADVTYTVIYKPTLVDYKVIHMQQNVEGDGYTKVLTETLQGLTGSYVGDDLANEYTGFKALLYDTAQIAADGSTEVEIKYDRMYYLMTFNLDGGYGVEPIYARYGSAVTVGTPKRAGYSFNGWSPEVPTTVPENGGTYTAQWTANDTAKVKVVIWGENPNDEEYSYLTTGELMLTPNTEYTYNGTDQLYLYCDKEAHTHDASCIICGKVEHTQHTEACLGECTHTEHTLACYSAGNNKLVEATKPSQITNYPTDGIYTYTTSVPVVGDVTHYYLYLGGKWYCADGNWPYGGDTTKITLNCTHTHTDECYTCETHAHTAACYRCGKEEHSHDSNCTGSVEGLDSTKWKFVKSDTVTVNPDGSSVINVYYDRVEYTVQFYNRRGNTEYTEYKITAKWGEFIQDKWPVVNGNSAWYVSTSSSTFQAGIQVMPVGGAKFYGPMDGSAGEAYYYVEALQGVTPDTTYQNVGYVLHHKDNVPSDTTVTEEDKYAIEGFTYYAGTSNRDDLPGAKFYYTRHRYVIEFYSPTQLLKKTENVPYESALSSYNWTPDATQAPVQYEPGSVVFEGWYLNPECTGDKFDFTTHTMPAGTKDGDTTLTLYAKWVPVTHTVNFYLDKAAYEAGTTLNGYPEVTVPHGSKVEPTPAKPENGSYEFISWFYMDNGVEKAFDFANMPVNKDLQVYGKWSANAKMPYTVYYMIQGTETEIADRTTGEGLVDMTKTFAAKGDKELYPAYREGYFPVAKSHSMVININGGNEYIFEYVQKDAVPYTVYYVTETPKESDEGKLETIELDGKTYYMVAEPYTDSDNRKAVVTENFKAVPGYMPDKPQKRLVVSAEEGAENVIIFVYTINDKQSYYKTTHYIQPLEGNDWTEYQSETEIGNIGDTYTASPIEISGFTFDETVEGTKLSGELTAELLELKLYYTRNQYPYIVRYLEEGTNKALHDEKSGEAQYHGKVISETAVDIDGYSVVGNKTQTLAIQIEPDPTKLQLNILTFYYKEEPVTIHYQVVGPNGCGTVDLNDTNENTVPGLTASESVKVKTGIAVGATAAPAAEFKFVGWYTDISCEEQYKITKAASYVPSKEANALWIDGTTYYAKFEYNLTTFTITKEVNALYENDDRFVFDVVGSNGAKFSVTLAAGQTVTVNNVTVGDTYTVTERTAWSWRYGCMDEAQELTMNPSGNAFEFNNTLPSINYWLSGSGVERNKFN